MSKQDSRAGQLNAVIEPKLLFLAKLAARRNCQTLVEFIEAALEQALVPDLPWMDDLWVTRAKPNHDAAARLFEVGRKDVNLLAPKQRALFHHIVTELAKQGKKLTRNNFVGFIEFEEGDE